MTIIVSATASSPYSLVCTPSRSHGGGAADAERLFYRAPPPLYDQLAAAPRRGRRPAKRKISHLMLLAAPAGWR
jgi:hypothetical protein